jgi:hypothetical protein
MTDQLSYKEVIEELKELPDFEAQGDAMFLRHEDDEARLEWAFYRPSGSHPDQVSDPSVLVSVMAFNHSRLGALERFTRLHDAVIADDRLRVKVRNRSRMLFRAMVDDDFTELAEVLTLYPVFMDLACDQMINGRIWNESYADPVAASRFLELAGDAADGRVIAGLRKRLQPLMPLGTDRAKSYLDRLCANAQRLHPVIANHYVEAYEKWMANTQMHPLQKIVWQKQIAELSGEW